jgi:single-strand selective monofunctional uracil DNA glycosylase
MPDELLRIEGRMTRELETLPFSKPVEFVYNPLQYANAPHEAYVRRFASRGSEVILLGMNPGPFGMAQTGVPFGEVSLVRDWMGIRARVGRPPREHPKRPIQGFDCPRSEVSGARLWGWARDRFEIPARFFARFFVINYCPLVFMEASGRNRTPDKCRKVERDALYAICDRALRASIEHLEPEWVIGVGAFAEERAARALDGLPVRVGRMLHPSPQSPAANRGWAEAAERDLAAAGIVL